MNWFELLIGLTGVVYGGVIVAIIAAKEINELKDIIRRLKEELKS